MSFGSRLRDKRKQLGITQPQLADMLGVSQSAIGSWETDVNSPRATVLYDLFDILHCDANYLLQDETRELYKDTATPDEFENIIKKYRAIDDHGRDMVDTVLTKEYDRYQREKESKVIPLKHNDKAYLEPQAAHKRTDITDEDITDDMKQHDMDIMNNDDFWK